MTSTDSQRLKRGQYTGTPEDAYQKNKNKNVEQFYDQWAATYNDEVRQQGYKGPEIMTPFFEKYFKKADSICDLGAGTGRIGEILTSLGFQNTTALDASQAMLKVAQDAGTYGNYVHCLLDTDPEKNASENFPGYPYDGLVGSGIISPRHLGPSYIPAIMGLVRPAGGQVILSVNERWMRGHEPELDWDFSFRDELRSAEARGLLKILEMTTFDDCFRTVVVLQRL